LVRSETQEHMIVHVETEAVHNSDFFPLSRDDVIKGGINMQDQHI